MTSLFFSKLSSKLSFGDNYSLRKLEGATNFLGGIGIWEAISGWSTIMTRRLGLILAHLHTISSWQQTDCWRVYDVLPKPSDWHHHHQTERKHIFRIWLKNTFFFFSGFTCMDYSFIKWLVMCANKVHSQFWFHADFILKFTFKMLHED